MPIKAREWSFGSRSWEGPNTYSSFHSQSQSMYNNNVSNLEKWTLYILVRMFWNFNPTTLKITHLREHYITYKSLLKLVNFHFTRSSSKLNRYTIFTSKWLHMHIWESEHYKFMKNNAPLTLFLPHQG